MTDLRARLQIPTSRLDAINAVLLDPNSRVMSDMMAVIAKYGTPEEINHKHRESRKMENLFRQVEAKALPYIKDLNWLIEQRDRGAFVSVADYRQKVLGEAAKKTNFKDDQTVLAGKLVALSDGHAAQAGHEVHDGDGHRADFQGKHDHQQQDKNEQAANPRDTLGSQGFHQRGAP